MLELVSVNLTNFRSFSEAEFVPLGIGQGMTAINGANGMGKSSVVHAITWALFGVTPDGVPVRALRRQNSEGDVQAVVVFRHDGQSVEVTRALRGRNDTTMASISVDGVEQTNISAKTATAWIQNRLGLDGEAFLTAFVVRQKELDSLVKARPAERRKTIERLAGIERMSAARDLARTDARNAQRLLEALPFSEDPQVTQGAMASAEDVLTDARTLFDANALTATTLRTAANEAAAQAQAARTATRTVQEAANQVNLASHKLDGENDRVDRLTIAAVGAEKLAAAVAGVELARTARSVADNAVAAVTSLTREASAAEARLVDAETTQARLQRDADAAAGQVDEAQLAAVLPVGFAENLTDKESQLEQLGLDRGSARGEWDRLKLAIATLRTATEGNAAECPTCAHPLADPDALVAEQEITMGDVKSRGTALTASFNAMAATITELHTVRSTTLVAAQQLASATQRATEADAAVVRAAALVARHADEAAAATAAAGQAQAAAAAAAAGLAGLVQAEKEAQATLRNAENAAQAASELTGATAAQLAARTVLQAAQERLNVAEAALLGLDPDQLDRSAAETARDAQLAGEEAAAAKMAHALADRDLTSAQQAHARALSAAQARQASFAEVERTTAIAAALEEFRRDRLARLAPELSEVASDFVTRMTNGRFTALELDEEFTPVLTDASGQQRPVAWLSGGEESAVALALRVAIGEVLAGHSGGLLILDEALTAQDQDRRQATMAAIRALPRQVITINHVSEATDMVDLVADVVDDGDGGSTITAHAQEGALSGLLSDDLVDA